MSDPWFSHEDDGPAPPKPTHSVYRDSGREPRVVAVHAWYVTLVVALLALAAGVLGGALWSTLRRDPVLVECRCVAPGLTPGVECLP